MNRCTERITEFFGGEIFYTNSHPIFAIRNHNSALIVAFRRDTPSKSLKINSHFLNSVRRTSLFAYSHSCKVWTLTPELSCRFSACPCVRGTDHGASSLILQLRSVMRRWALAGSFPVRRSLRRQNCAPAFGMTPPKTAPSTISLLAFRAVVAAAAGDDHALDGSLADEAGLAFASIDAVLKLKESLVAFGVDVIGD